MEVKLTQNSAMFLSLVLFIAAVLECGTCYANTSVAEAAKDCAGACSGNVVVIVNEEEVCVPEEQAGNFTMCDGQRQSDARINECGVCYGGNTGLEATEGYDDCGDCIDAAAPPPECENCEEIKDDCGVCNVPDSDKWNGKLYIILKLFH